MSCVPHELADDFPGEVDRIHALNLSDAHLARLVDECHDSHHAVHRAEPVAEPVSEATEAESRQGRMVLNDRIATFLSPAGSDS
ncbi:MAG: hypothetical protein AAGA70_07065 [Pseudomonadota bacterium]